MSKDAMISLRMSSELLARIDNAAALLSKAQRISISRNAFIERELLHAVEVIENDAATTGLTVSE